MIVLDTNVISEAMKPQASPAVRAWLNEQAAETLYLTSVTLAEMLFGIEITERCKVLRVMLCEMSRIISHLVWLGTTCIDIGAFTPFLWAFQEREKIYDLQEMWTGARLTTSLTRVGGLLADIPDGFVDKLRDHLFGDGINVWLPVHDERTALVRLVAISGYSQPEDVRRSLEAGFDAHVAKPARTEEIERLLS